MIISNTHKYIFVAIPKTATHAIRFALREHMDESKDWEHVSKFVTKRLPIAAFAQTHHGHLKCKDVKPHIDIKNWERYFKFVVCRNPYDRFISSCFFLYRNVDKFNENPVAGMRRIISSPQEMSRILLQPQNKFITDENGNLMVDYIGAFENLNGAYQHICENISVPFKPLDNINTSKHGNYTEYLDSELKQAVLDFYKVDFELLGYET